MQQSMSARHISQHPPSFNQPNCEVQQPTPIHLKALDTLSLTQKDQAAGQPTARAQALALPSDSQASNISCAATSHVPVFSYQEVDTWPDNKPFPPIFKVDQAKPESRAAKAFNSFSLKIERPQAVTELFQLSGVLSHRGWSIIPSEYLDKVGMDRHAFGQFIPKPLLATARTINFWNPGAMSDLNGLRRGVVFHIDGADAEGHPASSEGATVLLQAVSRRNYFFYTPEQFASAVKFAAANAITLPAASTLKNRFPGLSAESTASFTKMGDWYAHGFQTMQEHNVGPVTMKLNPGEFCVFKNGTIHGTLDNGEPYAAVFSAFNLNITMHDR